MSVTRYLFDLEMPPVYLGETVTIVTRQPDVRIAYEETLTWDEGAAVGLIRVETGTLAIIDDLERWWRLKQRAIGFPFSLSIRVGNRALGKFGQLPAGDLKTLVAQGQPEMVERLTEGEVRR
jgi:hypothetical protein